VRDLTKFGYARLAEDERADWHVYDCAGMDFGDGCGCGVPERMRREVAVKRKILALHEPLPSSYGEPSVCPSCWPQPWVGTHPLAPCPTMRHLVAVYSNHPDYRDEWKPSP
jgi:hypothetical protein